MSLGLDSRLVAVGVSNDRGIYVLINAKPNDGPDPIKFEGPNGGRARKADARVDLELKVGPLVLRNGLFDPTCTTALFYLPSAADLDVLYNTYGNMKWEIGLADHDTILKIYSDRNTPLTTVLGVPFHHLRFKLCSEDAQALMTKPWYENKINGHVTSSYNYDPQNQKRVQQGWVTSLAARGFCSRRIERCLLGQSVIGNSVFVAFPEFCFLVRQDGYHRRPAGSVDLNALATSTEAWLTRNHAKDQAASGRSVANFDELVVKHDRENDHWYIDDDGGYDDHDCGFEGESDDDDSDEPEDG